MADVTDIGRRPALSPSPLVGEGRGEGGSPKPPLGAHIVVIFPDAERKAAFVRQAMGIDPARGLSAALRQIGEVAYVSPGATLLSGFSVAENLSLPLLARRPQAGVGLPVRVRRLCRQAALSFNLLARQTDRLSVVERIQASFLQAMLAEPEVILFDAVLDGLGTGEQAQVAALAACFHRLYPLRRSIYLGYAAPPDVLYPATSIVEDCLEIS